MRKAGYSSARPWPVMVWRISALAAVIFCMAVFTACTGQPGEKNQTEGSVYTGSSSVGDRYRIGVSLASEEALYQSTLGTYLEQEAEKQEVGLEVHYAAWDVDTQTSQLDQFISQKVDAIIVCPVNAKAILNPLKRAKEAGIPVINLNMKVDSASAEYVSTYVGSSSAEQGEMAAELAEQLLPEGGNIGIIEGSPGSDPQIYRTQNFMDKISDYNNLKVVEIRNGKWDRHMAKLIALDMLSQNPDLKLIYCHDNTMAEGAAEAVQETGKSSSVKVIGIGEVNSGSTAALKNGTIAGFISQSPEYEGTMAVVCACQAIEGMELRPWMKNPSEIITMKNIDDYQKPSENTPAY